MVRFLLLLSLFLSTVAGTACSSFPNCSPEKTLEAPTVLTNDAAVAIVGGVKGGPGGPESWESHYGEVTLHGWLTHLGSAGDVLVGFYWGPNSVSASLTSGSYPNECLAAGTGVYNSRMHSSGVFEGNFTSQVYTQPDTTYYFRAYASGDGTAWGDEYTFHTNPTSVLTLTEHSAGYAGTTLEVTGQAGNRTSQTLAYGSVTVTFKDAQGTILGTASDSTNNRSLGYSAEMPPGDIFTFYVRYENASNVASYELSFSTG
jgi:hypothetical protein